MSELSTEDTITFLKLVANLQGSAVFERKLGMNRREVERYKTKLGVDSQEKARILLRDLEAQSQSRLDALAAEVRKAQLTQAVAQARLDEYEEQKKLAKLKKAATNKVDPEKVAKEDAERQRRFEESQPTLTDSWRLPAEASVRLFESDLKHRGLAFTANKYNATKKQVKAEAIRLEIRVDWDTLKS